MPITFLTQEGFGAFAADLTIPTLIDPGGGFGDPPVWLAQYIIARGQPVRLKSILTNGFRQDFDIPSLVSQAVPYWVAVGPVPQDAQVASQNPIPAALFQTNSYPSLVSLQIFLQQGYVLWEAGLSDVNPWWERTWSEHEIVATDGNQIVVAAGTPLNVGSAAPQTEPNTFLWLSAQGYDDVPVYTYKESSLARYPQ